MPVSVVCSEFKCPTPRLKCDFIIQQWYVYLSESLPYEDVDDGGSEAPGNLRLDDDNEFPPMTHENDWTTT
jgi:hypothetical protein